MVKKAFGLDIVTICIWFCERIKGNDVKCDRIMKNG